MFSFFQYINDLLPASDEHQSLGKYWNRSVFASIDFLANFPTKLCNGKDYLVDLVSPPEIVESSKQTEES